MNWAAFFVLVRPTKKPHWFFSESPCQGFLPSPLQGIGRFLL